MPLFSKKPRPPLPGSLRPYPGYFTYCFHVTDLLIKLVHFQKEQLETNAPIIDLRANQQHIKHHLNHSIIAQTHPRRHPGEPWLDGFIKCWRSFEDLYKEEFSNNPDHHDEAIERGYLSMHVPTYDRLLPLLERLFKEIGVWKFGGEAEWEAQNREITTIKKT